MPSNSDVVPLPIPQIDHAHTEVRKAIKTLLVLAESTAIELWPAEMQACYGRAMDELATLEASFYLYKFSFPQNEQAASDGDGLSASL